MKSIRIATIGTPRDYQSSLLPIVIQHLGYEIKWVQPAKADLLILGPFIDPPKKEYGWLPKPLRPLACSVGNTYKEIIKDRKYEPLKIFHTQENVRYDQVKADFSISFDLGVQSDKHFRLPYWMEMLDWSHEGVTGNTNPRYGGLMKISSLMNPLGNQFLRRGNSCAILSSHLREPRGSLYKAIKKIIPIQGFGAYFNESIKDHHSSGFLKKDILEKFAFNLCPENGLYPGYYTEKIPEAFNSGCLPITWTDENINQDFNRNAFINLLPYAKDCYEGVNAVFSNTQLLEQFSSQALLIDQPSLEPFKNYLKTILESIK